MRVRVVSNLSLSKHHTHAAHGRRVDVDIEQLLKVWPR